MSVLTWRALADEGFELLYTDSATPVAKTCFDFAPGTLSGLDGFLLLPALAQFSMGPTKFAHLFDSFAKMHRFDFDAATNTACFTAAMINTGFWNESVASGTIAPGVFFMEVRLSVSVLASTLLLHLNLLPFHK